MFLQQLSRMGLEHAAALYWAARLPGPGHVQELPKLHVGGKLLRCGLAQLHGLLCVAQHSWRRSVAAC